MPNYTYRKLPHNIVPDDKLWAVSGHCKGKGSGVLEWCRNKKDAKDILAKMRLDKRFSKLRAHKWGIPMKADPAKLPAKLKEQAFRQPGEAICLPTGAKVTYFIGKGYWITHIYSKGDYLPYTYSNCEYIPHPRY